MLGDICHFRQANVFWCFRHGERRVNSSLMMNKKRRCLYCAQLHELYVATGSVTNKIFLLPSEPNQVARFAERDHAAYMSLKKNLDASKPSEHSLYQGGKSAKRSGAVNIGCKDKTSW